MRERLATAFVLTAVFVLLLAGLIRAWAVGDVLRDQEVAHLRDDARLVAAAVERSAAAGDTIDQGTLRAFLRSNIRIEYVDADGESVVVTGRQFVARDVVTSQAAAGDGVVLLRAGAAQEPGPFTEELPALLVLLVLVSLLAALAGWGAARWLAAPFRSLADAAAAFGRGRFDVQLPETRIPEAQAIGQALRVSAAQLEARLSRERDFVERVSHELRTPLTSLRLELEDMTWRPDVPSDVREAARRCLGRVDAVNEAAGEAVALSRQGVLVEGGQVRLGDLATNVTQVWSDRLAASRRTVTARAEGEVDLVLTPGPVEQILDIVLDDVARGEGPVELVFEGSDGHVRVVVPAGVAGSPPVRGVEVARGLALPQGGRISGDLVTTDLDLWMPRR
jgi:signal transduction histidine kinase